MTRTTALSALLLGLVLASEPCAAQSISDLTAGVRVRVAGERATDIRVEKFALEGTLISVDPRHIVVRQGAEANAPDTLALIGVHQFDVFTGLRSRKTMVITGGTVGALASIAAWAFARVTLEPDHVIATAGGTDPVNVDITPKPPKTIANLRTAIPFVTAAGMLLGAVLGREQWESVTLPTSTFPSAPVR